MRGFCLWCGCAKGHHHGAVPDAVKERFKGMGIKWYASACSRTECANGVKGCRRYE